MLNKRTVNLPDHQKYLQLVNEHLFLFCFSPTDKSYRYLDMLLTVYLSALNKQQNKRKKKKKKRRIYQFTSFDKINSNPIQYNEHNTKT